MEVEVARRAPGRASLARSIRKASAPGRATRVRWQIFLLVWLLIIVNFIDRSSLSVAMPLIGRQMRLSPATMGWLLSSFFWGYAVVQLPGGWLVDRFGARRVIAFTATLWAVFESLAGLSVNSVTLLASRIGLGAAEAPIYPAAMQLTNRWLPPGERARGATLIDSGAALGMAVGGVVVSGFIGWLGSWRAAFLVIGVLTLAVSSVVYRTIRSDPREHRRVNQAELALVEAEPGARDPSSAGPGQLLLTDILMRRSFWAMFFGRLGWALVWWGLLTWGPEYLSQARHFSLATVGYSSFIIYGAATVGELLAGYLADRWRRHSGPAGHVNVVMKVLLGGSAAVTVASLFLLPEISSPLMAVVVLSAALFFTSWGGLYWTVPAMLAPRQSVGLVGGAMNLASSLGGLIAPIIIGQLVGLTGSYTAALIFLAMTGVIYFAGSMVLDFSRPLATRRG
jgi:MFS transporter, ACS family, D-galactonate transporter